VSERITLAEALARGDLEAFVRQAEAAGIGPADPAEFERLVERVTAPQPSGRTSRSSARGDSGGK
jgi:hypothetical protein